MTDQTWEDGHFRVYLKILRRNDPVPFLPPLVPWKIEVLQFRMGIRIELEKPLDWDEDHPIDRTIVDDVMRQYN